MRYQSAVIVSILCVLLATPFFLEIRGQSLFASPTRLLQLGIESQVRQRERREATRILTAKRLHIRLRAKMVAIDELVHEMWKANGDAMIVPFKNQQLASEIEELAEELKGLTRTYR